MARNPHKVNKFADEYIGSNFNRTKAMKSVSPNLEGNSLRVMACRWLHSPQVLETIVKKVNALNLTPEKVKGVLSARLMDIILSYEGKEADVIGASNLLAKLKKLTSDNLQATQINIYQDVAKEFEYTGHPSTQNMEQTDGKS